jgi:undecaprenyl diphosphate synthase
MKLSRAKNRLPQHIAIIMDGNGRWAKNHNLPRQEGHKQGAACAQRIVELCIKYKIPFLTLYAFSTENWNRPRLEVDGLFSLLNIKLDDGIKFALKNNVRFRHLGKMDRLPQKIQEKIREGHELTKNNTAVTVCIAFNYGGRDEIVEATKAIVDDKVKVGDINESLLSRYLFTDGIPDPDLIIRTGGEMRLSNFLLWQAAYAEIYFTDVLWPDFDQEELDKALASYSKRKRRFGKI